MSESSVISLGLLPVVMIVLWLEAEVKNQDWRYAIIRTTTGFKLQASRLRGKDGTHYVH